MSMESPTAKKKFPLELPKSGEANKAFSDAVTEWVETIVENITPETEAQARLADEIFSVTQAAAAAGHVYKPELVNQLESYVKEFNALGAGPQRRFGLHIDEITHLAEIDPDKLLKLLEWAKKKKNARREWAGFAGTEHFAAQSKMPALRRVELEMTNIKKIIGKIKAGENVDENKQKILTAYQELLAGYKQFYSESKELHQPTNISGVDQPADRGDNNEMEALPKSTKNESSQADEAARRVREDVEEQFDTVRVGSGVYVGGNNTGQIIAGGAKVKFDGGAGMTNMTAAGGGSVVERGGGASGEAQPGPAPSSAVPAEAAPASPPTSPTTPDVPASPDTPATSSPEPIPTTGENTDQAATESLRAETAERKELILETLRSVPSFSESQKTVAEAMIVNRFSTWEVALENAKNEAERNQIKVERDAFINQVIDILTKHGQKLAEAEAAGKLVFTDPDTVAFFNFTTDSVGDTTFSTERKANKLRQAPTYDEAVEDFVIAKRALKLAEKAYLIDGKDLIQEANTKLQNRAFRKSADGQLLAAEIRALESTYREKKIAYAQALQQVLRLRSERNQTNGSSSEKINYDRLNGIMAARFFGTAGDVGYRSTENQAKIAEVNRSEWSTDTNGNALGPRDIRSYRERELAFATETLPEKKRSALGGIWQRYRNLPATARYALGGTIAGTIGVATGAGVAQALARYLSGAAGGAVAGAVAGSGVRWIGNKFVRRYEKQKVATKTEVLSRFDAEKFAELEQRLYRSEAKVARTEKIRDGAAMGAAVTAGFFAGRDIGEAVEDAYANQEQIIKDLETWWNNKNQADDLAQEVGSGRGEGAQGVLPSELTVPPETPVAAATDQREGGVPLSGDPTIYDPVFQDVVGSSRESVTASSVEAAPLKLEVTIKPGDTVSELIWDSLRGRGEIAVPTEYQAAIDGMSKNELLGRMYEVINDLKDEPEVLKQMGIESANIDLIYPEQTLDMAEVYERMFPDVERVGGLEERISEEVSTEVPASATGAELYRPGTVLPLDNGGRFAGTTSDDFGRESTEFQVPDSISQVIAETNDRLRSYNFESSTIDSIIDEWIARTPEFTAERSASEAAQQTLNVIIERQNFASSFNNVLGLGVNNGLDTLKDIPLRSLVDPSQVAGVFATYNFPDNQSVRSFLQELSNSASTYVAANPNASLGAVIEKQLTSGQLMTERTGNENLNVLFLGSDKVTPTARVQLTR